MATRRLTWWVACLAVLARMIGSEAGAQPAGEAADAPAQTVKVAAVQCHSVFGDVVLNRIHLAALVRRAARKGAKIIVLPETAVTGYMSDDIKRTWQTGDREISDGLTGVDPKAAAETVPGPSTRVFGKLADELDVYLTVPLIR